VSSIDVLRGCCRLGGAHGGGGGAGARVLGPEDFVVAAGEAKWHAFELVRRLSEVEAEAARQRAALETRTDVAISCEYEQWRMEAATRRIKKEIFDLDDE
jgi:hypothetical protein